MRKLNVTSLIVIATLTAFVVYFCVFHLLLPSLQERDKVLMALREAGERKITVLRLYEEGGRKLILEVRDGGFLREVDWALAKTTPFSMGKVNVMKSWEIDFQSSNSLLHAQALVLERQENDLVLGFPGPLRMYFKLPRLGFLLQKRLSYAD